ncbi:MAG: ABC transporter ATP-binding protein/permease [Gammaproteobacteria bacterium]|jgi:ABC-type multidrug transport system fused ATPase/permease subunit|nr:ABC transporter ATP-binding protein/permease [Gammaproteobacteria bacterium]
MPQVLRQLLDLLTADERRQGLLLLMSMVLVAAVETAGIASIMPFMAVVSSPELIETNRWLKALYDGLAFESQTAFLRFLGIVVVAFLFFSTLLKAGNNWLVLRFDNKINYVLARRLLARYMSRPYEFFLNRNTAELGKNILTEARNVVIGVVSPIGELVSRGLIALAIMALLVAVDPFVAVLIASVLGGAYALVYLIARSRLHVIGEQQVEANAGKYKAADEALSGIKELKILGREHTFLERFSLYAERHARNNVAAGLISDMPRHALEVIAFGGILLVVLYLLGRTEQQETMVPLLALYAFAGYRLLPALQQLFAAFALLRRSVAALEVLHRDLMPEPGERMSAEQRLAARTQIAALPLTTRLELRNVSFRYAGASKPAIQGLDLDITANTSVGLVGPSGCGKTTTVDLILGLLAPASGEMCADGVPITAENMAAWQRNVGYVPQQIYISDDTVTRNIAFGIPDDEVDMDAVRNAARVARLAEFVETAMPLGYDTVIGESGARLSGGQRQRIGIARALYRDPAILILDEATSALDGITEESVMDAVHELSKKKTIIIIAHRLTTVRDCDVICLLEHGRIAMRGSYEDLKRDSPWFRSAAGG